MELKDKQYDVGVIVGRFQVHELHDAHLDLIQTVVDQHAKVLIFLGLSPLPNSASNPLDFQARKQMILESFPDVSVLYIKDQYEDRRWSADLDNHIRSVIGAHDTVVLYGGRSSFIGHYTGKFDTRELEPANGVYFSGTETRRQIAKGATVNSEDFRAGAIWASAARFPVAYTTVDVAILDGERILLGRKPGESQYRFIGGFSDPATPSFEADAIREVREETGLEVGDLKYVGSTLVDDWRYRSEQDGIKTLFFTAKYLHGAPRADDDIEEVRWFVRDFLKSEQLIQAHRPLLDMLYTHFTKIAKGA